MYISTELRVGFIMEPYQVQESVGFITLVVQTVGTLERDVHISLSLEGLQAIGKHD
jgi:hypothetical protein